MNKTLKWKKLVTVSCPRSGLETDLLICPLTTGSGEDEWRSTLCPVKHPRVKGEIHGEDEKTVSDLYD